MVFGKVWKCFKFLDSFNALFIYFYLIIKMFYRSAQTFKSHYMFTPDFTMAPCWDDDCNQFGLQGDRDAFTFLIEDCRFIGIV